MIGFKDGKDRAMNAVSSAAMMAAQNASYSMTGQPLNQALAFMIAEAVKAGIEEMLEQQYTYSDLERDIKLDT